MEQTPQTNETRVEPRQRALLETMRRRRRRIIQHVALYIFATAVIIVLAMLQRDSAAIGRSKQYMEHVRDGLAEAYTEGHLPTELPAPSGIEDDEVENWRGKHLYLPNNVARLYAHDEVVICCSDPPVRMYLQQEGRHVVLFDGEQFELVWMSDREFRRRAEDLAVKPIQLAR